MSDAAAERMSRRDFSWFRMDSARNLMVINSVLSFDGPLDFAALRRTIAQRLPHYARFTQVVRTRLGRPYWVHDPAFDIGHHVQLDTRTALHDEQALHRLLGEQALAPLPAGRPLWHMRVLPRPGGDGFAIVFRLHHCITDGEGLVHVLKHLTDDTEDHGPVPSMEWHPQHARGASKPLCTRLQGLLFWSRIGAQLARLTVLPHDRRSALKRPLSRDKTLAQLPPLNLNLVRSIAKRMNATINDVWVAAVAAALRHYLLERGEPVDDAALRAAVTFNLRNKGDAFLLGNHFGLVAVGLPTQLADACERLRHTKRRMDAIKASHQPHATMFFLTLTGYLPRALQALLLRVFTAKGSVVLTNVEGPQQVRYLAGARLASASCWVPQAGTMGVGFALMSYAGQIQLSMFADRNQVADPERLLALLGEAFTQLDLATRSQAQAAEPGVAAAPQEPAASQPVVQ